MFLRNALLVLGILFIIGSAAIGYVWLSNEAPPAEAARPEAKAPQSAPPRAAVLAAAHRIPSGTLLQPGDLAWKDVDAGELHPGSLVRGKTSEADYAGAIVRREFSPDEPFAAQDLLKLTDRRFLAAVLRPGNRAISISVDAAQSASGLILPGNRVDVILTQSVTDASWEGKRKVVAETFLHDIRVIAVDQSLSQQPRAAGDAPILTEPRLPKTVTLELSERQAEMVFVALQLGTLQLAVRPLEASSDAAGDGLVRTSPTWAFDVSPALRQMALKPAKSLTPASPLEGSIRRPPAS